MSGYINAPTSISYKSLENNGYILSSFQYKDLIMPNKNYKFVRDMLSHPLTRNDLGYEVGSSNYIGKSPYYFLRAKALQSYSYLPDITSETALPIMPNAFIDKKLIKGDLLISKDSNIGETVILDKDYPNYMVSSAIYRLPISENKYYLFAFSKHSFFREHLDAMVPKGATIRHAKTFFLDCKIPFPNKNKHTTIKYIELLTQAIINKEIAIRKRYHAILDLIEEELMLNQNKEKYKFNFPTINEIDEIGRFDTNLYRNEFKEVDHLIKNYSNGSQTIFDYGFTLSRGQNLQVSNIGPSIYSDEKHANFYTLMLPKFLSKYGTVDKVEYLGNPNPLKTLKRGDLIFGAEGFEKGRSIVVIEEKENTITNIHGITIQQEEHDIIKAIFIKCCLDYMRNKGLIDLFAVGGNGGSLAQKYWASIHFPKFPRKKQEEISKLYHTKITPNAATCTILDFLDRDSKFNNLAGVVELDKSIKKIQKQLTNSIDRIINDTEVDIKFDL